MAKRRRYYSAKRRAIYAKGEEFHCLEIFERDGWVCQLCDRPINRFMRYPAWGCATLDHIVPLSRGGSHTRDNVQASHRRCNELKGDSLTGPMDYGTLVTWA